MNIEVGYFKQIASELLINHVPRSLGKDYSYLNEDGYCKGMTFILNNKKKSPKMYEVQLTLKKGFFRSYLEVYCKIKDDTTIVKGFKTTKQAVKLFEKVYNKRLSDKRLEAEQSRVKLLKNLVKNSF